MSDDCPIEVRDLTKRYRSGAVAVDSLSFEVRRGEIFGFLGPNGAGKSTTVKVLTTLLPPTEGTAIVAGHDVRQDPVLVKRSIGVVNQTNALDADLTVARSLFFHARYFGFTRAAAQEATDRILERFDLGAHRDQLATRLSGGDARRVAVARAVVHEPRILFLDEPSVGLDPHNRLELWRVLQNLQADGVTILLTTHDMDEAERLCDRVGLIDAGKLKVIGPPLDLVRDHGRAARIIATGVDDTWPVADDLDTAGAVESWTKSNGRIEIVTREPEKVLATVLAAVDATAALESVSVIRPSLETAFMTLTGRRI